MSRYIDAENIEYTSMCRARGDGMYEDCEIAYKDEIDDIPTADVVKVVRCKDCKHNYRRTTWNHGERDNPDCKYTNYVRDNDFYCKFGERVDT